MIIKVICLGTVSLFITMTNAHAYLDPGTGSIILSAIIGAIAAGVTFLKIYWYKFLKLIGIKNKNSVNQKNTEEDKK